MEDIKQLLNQLKVAQMKAGLPDYKLSAELGYAKYAVSKWYAGRGNPSKESQERIKAYLAKQGSMIPSSVPSDDGMYLQCDQLKHLLILLEYNLRHFQNGNVEARQTLRKELNVADVHYVSSLLDMLCDEKNFQDWKAFSNYKYQGFRRVNGSSNSSQPS